MGCMALHWHCPQRADTAIKAALDGSSSLRKPFPMPPIPPCKLPIAYLALPAVLLSLIGAAPASSAAAPASVSIFNGRDFAGWAVPAPNPFWQVVDGVLTGENDAALTGNVLHTEKSYHDFVLELEAKWTPAGDSGIMLRQPELQLQLGVSNSLKVDMTGSFYTGGADKYPAAGQAHDLAGNFKPGDWNRIRLEARGDTFTVWFNGRQVSRYVNPKYSGAAPIGLQLHPKIKMKAEFRQIRLQALD